MLGGQFFDGPPPPIPFLGAIRSSSFWMRKRGLCKADPAGGRDDVRSFMGFMTRVSSQMWPYADAREDDDGPATRRTRFRRFSEPSAHPAPTPMPWELQHSAWTWARTAVGNNSVARLHGALDRGGGGPCAPRPPGSRRLVAAARTAHARGAVLRRIPPLGGDPLLELLDAEARPPRRRSGRRAGRRAIVHGLHDKGLLSDVAICGRQGGRRRPRDPKDKSPAVLSARSGRCPPRDAGP